jgi:hypothetical protein
MSDKCCGLFGLIGIHEKNCPKNEINYDEISNKIARDAKKPAKSTLGNVITTNKKSKNPAVENKIMTRDLIVGKTYIVDGSPKELKKKVLTDENPHNHHAEPEYTLTFDNVVKEKVYWDTKFSEVPSGGKRRTKRRTRRRNKKTTKRKANKKTKMKRRKTHKRKTNKRRRI